jgi:hypothetical protein
MVERAVSNEAGILRGRVLEANKIGSSSCATILPAIDTLHSIKLSIPNSGCEGEILIIETIDENMCSQHISVNITGYLNISS